MRYCYLLFRDIKQLDTYRNPVDTRTPLSIEDKESDINNWLTCSQRHMIQEDHHPWMLLNLLQHPGVRETDKLSSCCHCCKNHKFTSMYGMKYDINPRTNGRNRYQMVKEWGNPQYSSSTSQRCPKGEHLPRKQKGGFYHLLFKFQVDWQIKVKHGSKKKSWKIMKMMDHVQRLRSD